MKGPYYHWDWNCERCGSAGSVPVDEHVSMLNACTAVAAHHGLVNEECHNAYQGRWIQVVNITKYETRRKRA